VRDSTDPSPLTAVQQCVVNALAAGATLSDAAEQYGLHRTTVYRWLKTRPEFGNAVHQARANFVLARRDDLYHLSNRAMETLLSILDNPKTPASVLYKTAVFILTRPQLPKTGWSMPEPTPDPDGKKLTDSSVMEQDYDGLPGIYGIERDEPTEAEEPAPQAAGATECNGMQHDSPVFEDVPPAAPVRQTGLRSCPVPPNVLQDRDEEAMLADLHNELQAIKAFTKH
jgi:hypothetical protein